MNLSKDEAARRVNELNARARELAASAPGSTIARLVRLEADVLTLQLGVIQLSQVLIQLSQVLESMVRQLEKAASSPCP